ncbi:MAG TPA: alkaline phosphatase family protein [Actinomycetota bacterium]|nr:alkaline phosphatase family protein [Actinomycetota bacterium]
MTTSRVLVVGWDGADWRILDPLLERGAVPNLAALIDRGGRTVLRSTLPTHSWTAWPSFLTGVDPAEHGVFDILDGRGGSKQFPVTYRSIKERTFLEDLSRAGVETLSVNVPLTFPPPEITGKVVAGGVLPKWRAFTHPDTLAADLEKANAPWPINGMSWTTYRNRPEAFLEEVRAVTSARQRGMEHLLDTTDWQVATLVYFSTDRVQHCLAKYVSPDHPEYAELSTTALGEQIRDVYRMLDDGLGRLLERARSDDLVVFMSDHGFHACTGAIHLDRLLDRLGYLRFAASNAIFGPMQWGPVRAAARKVYDKLGLHGRVSLPQAVDWSKTRAYTSIRSTGEGISVNLAGREPHGIVDPGDFERVRNEVAERVSEFVDPRTGERPVARVWLREEVFKGRFADNAPDLLLEPAPLYSLTHAKTVVEPADWLSGDHRVEGVLAAAGPGVDAAEVAGRPANLVDLAPTILAAAGAQPSVRHSGTVLTQLVGADATLAMAAASGGQPSESAPVTPGLDDAEAEEVEEHLRGLGYLE